MKTVVFGVVFAAAMTYVMFVANYIGVILAALLGTWLALRLSHRGLFGGATLITLGLIFIYFIWAATERCAQFNRQPGAFCGSYGVEQSVALVSVLVVLGVAMIAMSLRRGPSAAGRTRR